MRRIQGPYCCVGPILLCCIVMEISTGWGRFWWGRFDPSLAVRWLAPTTHSIRCLDSSLGRVPAYDAGDPGSIPGGGILNAWDTKLFWPLDPGSGIGFSGSRISDPGSQPHIFENLLTILVKKFYNSLNIGPNFFLQQFKTEIICNFVKFVAT